MLNSRSPYVLKLRYWILVALFIHPFLCPLTTLAQPIKERIGWAQYVGSVDGVTNTVLERKDVITYNKSGQILSNYLKQVNKGSDHHYDGMTNEYVYDHQGRLLLAQTYNRDGTLSRKEVYDYNTNNKYYTIKVFELDFESFQSIAYCYTNEVGDVVEKKIFEVEENTQKKIVSAWFLYTYSKGRLIGKRYKKKPTHVLPPASKTIYTYLPNTNKPSSVITYCWNEDGTDDNYITKNCIYYTYNEDDQLIKKEEGCQEGFEHNIVTTYQYKDDKLWIETKVTPKTPRMKEYRTVKIYKEGVLVRQKEYWFHYIKERNTKELGEEGLLEVIDYQYHYYTD